MSEKELKVGDKIRMVRTIEVDYDRYVKGSIGVISNIEHTGIFITMPEFNSGENRTFFCLESNFELVEPTNPKTAFLRDFSGLLRKYNAVINASWDEYFDNGYPKIDLDINFNGHVEGICFENVLDLSLTADNVLNYDKE